MKIPEALHLAARAASSRKAEDMVLLDLREVDAFTDFFLLVSGSNQKQLVAVADAVEDALRDEGLRPKHLEGYPRQEWILMDYGSFVVHVFTNRSRSFYDLERLWGGAKRIEVPA
jgi:ribosome-associated protein